ncbi:hypothetical protein KKC1_12000 [Calderihabitans maritimus]|uniref:Uncharacterized protein n=1 Tax=Calderihabitans maritimus TaxID=1246530 RepID=A0A1Z5HRY9_9FIRM|nr:hypothetical protein KKC1_12000 [Calderihabitans maritimus]
MVYFKFNYIKYIFYFKFNYIKYIFFMQQEGEKWAADFKEGEVPTGKIYIKVHGVKMRLERVREKKRKIEPIIVCG